MPANQNEPVNEAVIKMAEVIEVLQAHRLEMDKRLATFMQERAADGNTDYLENLQYLKPPPLGQPLPAEVQTALENLQKSLARPAWGDVQQLPVQQQDLGFLHQAKPAPGGILY